MNENTPSVREYVKILWDRKINLFIIGLLGFSISVAFAKSLPNFYQSTVTAMQPQDPSSRIAPLSGQVNSLASMAGINLNTGGSGNIHYTLSKMQSFGFIKEFFEITDAKKELYNNRWDSDKQEWGPSSENIFVKVLRFLTGPSNYSDESGSKIPNEPNDVIAYAHFMEFYTVQYSDLNGLVIISVNWRDPAIAKYWAETLMNLINTKIEEETLERTNENIAKLNNLVKESSVTSVRQAAFSLISQQLQSLLINRGTNEFGLSIIDGPHEAYLPVKPRRLLIIILGTMAFGFGACAYFIIYGARGKADPLEDVLKDTNL
ncbi:hypothetical protein OAQ01_00040 [Emcibacteraceae bacterium]|nr:hypothetical protein [Emcibacteraceae bacterium]